MMTKFVDYIFGNIKNIAENNLNESRGDSDYDLSGTLSDISSFMTKIGISNQVINDLLKTIETKFNNLTENGLTEQQAILESMESVNNFLNNNISSNSRINELNENSGDFNLDFANSLNSDNSLLIDQAISKGMSVEEAIKYVNNQMNNSDKIEFGPPSVAEIKLRESEEQEIKNAELENNLNILEADMDDQNAKTFTENHSTDDVIQNDSSSETMGKDNDNDGTT